MRHKSEAEHTYRSAHMKKHFSPELAQFLFLQAADLFTSFDFEKVIDSLCNAAECNLSQKKYEQAGDLYLKMTNMVIHKRHNTLIFSIQKWFKYAYICFILDHKPQKKREVLEHEYLNMYTAQEIKTDKYVFESKDETGQELLKLFEEHNS